MTRFENGMPVHHALLGLGKVVALGANVAIAKRRASPLVAAHAERS